MNTEPLTFYTDRSAIELDWQCGMALWWNRIEGERGIVPANQAGFFKVGGEIHEDMHWAATTPNPEVDIYPKIDEMVKDLAGTVDQLVLEPAYRRMGWLTAFCLYREPVTRRDYDTVLLETELAFDRDPLIVGVTPDRVLKSKATPSKLVYREYKSTITVGKKWQEYWPFAIQLHMGIAAAQEELKEKIAYAEIMGLTKGYEKGGQLRHPYVWAYYNDKTDEWQPEYKYGLTLRPVWEYPGGIIEWVKRCGPSVAEEQFPFSKPVFLDTRLLDQMVKRQMVRQQEILDVKEACRTDTELRAVHFEQRFKNCRPAWGGPTCPYLSACHNATINENPLASGEYVPRVPHHDLETVGEGD